MHIFAGKPKADPQTRVSAPPKPFPPLHGRNLDVRSGRFSPSLSQGLPALAVRAPGDASEQEADRISDRVAGEPARIGEPLHTGRAHPGDTAEATAPPIVHDVLRSPGWPLDPAIRAYYELRFGCDLGDVRVHTDVTAAHSARAVGARAYTVGQDIVFGGGRYDPLGAEGRRLMAHELAHTLQQRDAGGGGAFQLQRQEEDSDTAAPTGLRLVFVQENQSMEHNGNAIAGAIGALKLPYHLPKDFKPDKVGSIACAKEENVLQRAADYAAKLGRKVEMLHVIGHNYQSSGPACLHGGVTKENASFFSPSMTMVVHGCLGISRFPSERFLKALPGARVFVHSMCSEAGGPLDFTRVTMGEEGKLEKTQVESIVEEDVGFTEASIQAWAGRHVDALKGKGGANLQKSATNNIADWFDWEDFPAFRSAETATMARAVLADSEKEKIPKVIAEGAAKFLEKWDKEQSRDPYEGE